MAAAPENTGKDKKMWEEEDLFVIEYDIVHRAEEEYKFCLVGKFLTTKPVNEWAMQEVLKKIWRMPKEVMISEVGEGIFAFKFNSPILMDRVLEGGPWSFDDKILILRKWVASTPVEQYKFDTVETWVQARGLPFHLQNSEIGRKIGQLLAQEVEHSLNPLILMK